MELATILRSSSVLLAQNESTRMCPTGFGRARRRAYDAIDDNENEQ